MSNEGEGGRYVVGPDGQRMLVERTNWTPAAAPVEEDSATFEMKEDDDVFQKEIPPGED